MTGDEVDQTLFPANIQLFKVTIQKPEKELKYLQC